MTIKNTSEKPHPARAAMRTKLKYVTFIGKDEKKFPIVFPAALTHRDVAMSIATSGIEVNDQREALKPFSAGFVEVGYFDNDPHIQAVGESTSLNMWPHPDDHDLLAKLLGNSYE